MRCDVRIVDRSGRANQRAMTRVIAASVPARWTTMNPAPSTSNAAAAASSCAVIVDERPAANSRPSPTNANADWLTTESAMSATRLAAASARDTASRRSIW